MYAAAQQESSPSRSPDSAPKLCVVALYGCAPAPDGRHDGTLRVADRYCVIVGTPR